MNINDKQQSLIEKYLDKRLSDIQQLEFDKELKNEDFRKQLMFQARLIDTHRSIEQEHLINELESFAQANKSKKKGKKHLKFLIVIIAASLMLWGASFLTKDDVSGEQLYATHFLELPADVNKRGEVSNKSEIYNQAMQEYINGNYQAALDGLNKESTTDRSLLYIAVCHLKLGQFSKAEILLTKLKSSTDHSISENAVYYEAIIAVKNNDFNKAKGLLSAIINKKDHLFKAKAKELLSKL